MGLKYDINTFYQTETLHNINAINRNSEEKYASPVENLKEKQHC